MGQVLGFAHCKEAPSTASTTPDSTEGGPEEPEFPPELPAAAEPPEEEEEDEDGGTPPRTPPRELTFSYIAFGAGGSAPQTEPGPRCRRDPRRGRPPRLSSGPPPPPRGLDPALGVRAPPKRPGEPSAPPEGRLEVGGALQVEGGAEMEEPPMRLVAPPQPTGSAPQPPPPAPPPDPPPTQDPPPAPPDQSASQAGADALVWELLHWRDPARSALVLLSLLAGLCCLARFSAVSVGAYGALAVLGVTLPRRLHRAALRALRPPPHPGPREPSEAAVGLSPEEQQRWARRLARHLSAATRTLARLFLVHSVPESLKFAFLFYLLTYVGAVCNGLTLLGAGVICAFTFPVLYRHHQAQIDQYVTLVRSHLSHLRARIQAKLPSAKAKPQ